MAVVSFYLSFQLLLLVSYSFFYCFLSLYLNWCELKTKPFDSKRGMIYVWEKNYFFLLCTSVWQKTRKTRKYLRSHLACTSSTIILTITKITIVVIYDFKTYYKFIDKNIFKKALILLHRTPKALLFNLRFWGFWGTYYFI